MCDQAREVFYGLPGIFILLYFKPTVQWIDFDYFEYINVSFSKVHGKLGKGCLVGIFQCFTLIIVGNA